MSIHEDAFILTPDGERQLKGLKKVVHLLDQDGIFRPVAATLIEDYQGYFYEFHFKCFPFTLKCNANQTVYSVKDLGAGPENGEGGREAAVSMQEVRPAMVKASAIGIYEYLGMPFLQELTGVIPGGLPVDSDEFWYFIGILLNKTCFGKPPKIDADRLTVAVPGEEEIYIKYPPGINRIPGGGGSVMLNRPLAEYVASVTANPLQLLYLPKKMQSAIFDGFFFYEGGGRVQVTDNLNVLFAVWYMYCRINRKLAIIQSNRNREYKLSIPANPAPCAEGHMWFRIMDVKVSVERARVYNFRTEAPLVVVRNFMVKP